MKNKTNYPIVLEFYLLVIIFIDVYAILVSPMMFKIYAIVMLAILINSLINSIDNYNLENQYSGMFCVLDIIEYASFQMMVIAILRQHIAFFWLLSFVVQILYIPWNTLFLMTTPISAYAARKIRQYSVLDAISGLISLSIYILNRIYTINEWFLLIGFLSWLIILSMWAADNFSIGSKLDLPGSKIMLYDIAQDAWKSVKSISVDRKGIIKEVKFGDLCASPEPRTEFFMLPGLIDSHVHIDQNPYVASSGDDSLYDTVLNNALEAAENGITTVCDMGGKQINNYYIINKILKNASNISRIETSGCFCSKKYGHYMQHDGFIVEDSQSALIYANYLTKLGVRYAKIMLGKYEIDENGLEELIISKNSSDSRILPIIQSYYPNSSTTVVHDDTFFDCLAQINQLKAYTYQELVDIIKEFKKKDLIIFAHAFEEDDVKDAINAGIRRIEHVGDYSEELIQSIIDNDVIVTSTYVAAEDGVVLPSGLVGVSNGCTKALIEKWYYDTRKTLPKLYEKGVKVALGTDAGFMGTPFCSLTREIISLVSDLGVSVKKVLKSATIICAEKLSLNHSNNKIGELTPKAYADFVLYESNFIDDVNILLHPSQVWIRGELVYERKYD